MNTIASSRIQQNHADLVKMTAPLTPTETIEPQNDTAGKTPEPDRFIPQGPQKPSGQYWLEKSAEGTKVHFDDSKRSLSAPKSVETLEPAASVQPKTAGQHEPYAAAKPEAPDSDPAPADPEKKDDPETWICNTDQVDQEIKNLQSKAAALKQKISAASNESDSADLERELAKVEQELAQKDNDSYRRQHASFRKM